MTKTWVICESCHGHGHHLEYTDVDQANAYRCTECNSEGEVEIETEEPEAA